jgi:hypothetical protein
LLICGVGAAMMWVIGIVDGITYLTKTPEEFKSIYIDGHKEWF